MNCAHSLSHSGAQQNWCCAQRITYAKTKSDAVSKAEGTYVENKKDRQKHNQEQRGRLSLAEDTASGCSPALHTHCLIYSTIQVACQIANL